jgi:hypothetical protein
VIEEMAWVGATATLAAVAVVEVTEVENARQRAASHQLSPNEVPPRLHLQKVLLDTALVLLSTSASQRAGMVVLREGNCSLGPQVMQHQAYRSAERTAHK